MNKNLYSLDITSYIRNPSEFLKSLNFKKEDIIDCSLGVNPYGIPSDVLTFVKNSDWSNISNYPNKDYDILTNGLIEYWSKTANLTKNNLNITSGSSGGLVNSIRLLLNDGAKVLGYTPQFNEFEYLVRMTGCDFNSYILKEENNFKFDESEFLEMIHDDIDLIYLDNPNNPTGQTIDISTIKKIIEISKEKNSVVLVDEAYGDFMDRENSAINLINDYDNVFVVRSFSKGFGLANLRIGYIAFNEKYKEIYDSINIPPFTIPDVLQETANFVLSKNEYYKNTTAELKTNKEKLCSTFNNRLKFSESDLNVPIILMGMENSKDFYMDLLNIGIITTKGNDFKNVSPEYVRIRVPKEIDFLISRLELLFE